MEAATSRGAQSAIRNPPNARQGSSPPQSAIRHAEHMQHRVMRPNLELCGPRNAPELAPRSSR
eukprot:8410143-Alexandrium_andersonii.AAC.1